MTAIMVSVDEALSLIAGARLELPAEMVAVSNALGRTLAQPVIAGLTQPPLSVSAMDGYAVRLEDVGGAGARLRVIGEAPAGRPFEGSVGPGETVRIFTGGAVPDGADHIVIQEDVERDEDMVVVREGYATSRHIRAAGIDFSEGDVLLDAGTRLGAGELAVAAAANHAELSAYRRPVVALIANGDELRPPGSALAPGEIVSSNPTGLGALVESWGGVARDMGIAADTPEAIGELIKKARDADVIVPVGGASVGDHDHMEAAFLKAGFQGIFSKVAVRPGKPTWFGRLGHACVLGLPGNPASAFVCAHLFLKPLLTGLADLEMVRGKVDQPVAANGPREHFMRAQARLDAQGQLTLSPVASQDSSLLTPFLTANTLIRRLAHAPDLAEGDMAEAVLIGPLVRAPG